VIEVFTLQDEEGNNPLPEFAGQDETEAFNLAEVYRARLICHTYVFASSAPVTGADFTHPHLEA
jgi:hypothetical protein